VFAIVSGQPTMAARGGRSHVKLGNHSPRLDGHDWQNLAEWVRAIDELANMSDDEIEGLASATPEALPNAA
jgi:hypothetical protein